MLKDAAAIRRAMLAANADDQMLGVITWMHTFSPAKAWIAGLDALRKPLLHLHTQANVELPWASIDFDFMNLNQAAHGDREYAYLATRLGIARTTVAGHVSNPAVTARVGTWVRAAAGWAATHELKLASLTTTRPRVEIHPLTIGGREDPVRMVFDADPAEGAVVVSLADMRDRFRLTANVIDVITPPRDLPHLPVARAVWRPRPDFTTSAEAWLTAGGAHHTVLSTAARIDAFQVFADIARTELLVIDETTTRRAFADQVRWNQAYHRLAQGL